MVQIDLSMLNSLTLTKYIEMPTLVSFLSCHLTISKLLDAIMIYMYQFMTYFLKTKEIYKSLF